MTISEGQAREHPRDLESGGAQNEMTSRRTTCREQRLRAENGRRGRGMRKWGRAWTHDHRRL